MKFTKQLIVALAAFLIATLPVFSQQETTVEPGSDRLENSLLWEISGNELETPSYLYGTIHMIDEEHYFLTEQTKDAFAKTSKVTFEINMDDFNNLFTQLSLLMKIYMDNGTTLRDLLSEEEYELVKEHFSQMGLPFFFFERIKPLFLSAFASEDMDPTSFNSGDVKSYEMEFAAMARQQEKVMDGLETIEFQMSVFDSIPYEAQAQMLVESIKSSGEDTTDGEFDLMVKMYTEQDIEAMGEMITHEDSGYAEFEEILLVNRNKNWIPIMEKMMQEGPTFFAVGAGHLGGKMGVIRLLKERGYTLKPIK